MFEDPLFSDHIGARGEWHQVLGVVCLQGLIFLLHGTSPVRIDECITNGEEDAEITKRPIG